MWSGPYGDFGSRKYLISSLDQSLKRLQLEYVDIFYHHRMDKETPLEESMEALAQGMLTKRYLDGIPEDSRVKKDKRFLKESDITQERLTQIRALNVMAQKRGQTLSQMALSWVLKDEEVCSVLIGASAPEQILENLGCLENPMFSEEELVLLNKISVEAVYE